MTEDARRFTPRRVLTKLSEGVQSHDNAEHDYICRVSDEIVNPDNKTYEILERLGQGTFGQVLKCVNPNGGTPVALKIIKNRPDIFHQALVEVHILKMLNEKYDPDDDKRIVRMIDFFVCRKHLCIAFELLSVSLYDVLKDNSFRGVSMALIRVLTEQLLLAMQCLRAASVIHCDMKPENVLLSNIQHTRIKLIDFGSACFENHTVYSHIQSRFYRSPEVLLGLPYTTAIDMWSLGCICSELFLGLPIFPGHSEYDQVCRIVEVQGLPSSSMLDKGRNTRKYFRRVEEPLPADFGDEESMASGSTDCSDSDHGEGDDTERRDGSADARGETPMTATASGNSDGVPLLGPPWPLAHKRSVRTFWRLKAREEYERDEHKKELTPKKYFDFKSLDDFKQLPYKHGMSRRARAEEEERRQCFLQFLGGILLINPDERWTPKQATLTPFILHRPFDRDFSPVGDTPVPSFERFVEPQAPKITATATAVRHGSRTVPRLPGDVFGQGEGGGSSNSARTWQETQVGPNDDGQPRSAACSFRGAHAKSQSRATKTPDEAFKEASQVINDPVIVSSVRPDDMRGLLGHLCKGVPLPKAADESYRPPIEQLCEDFFRGVNRANEAAAAKSKGAVLGSPQTSGALSSGASASSDGAR